MAETRDLPPQPLAGRRVLVTRPAGQAEDLCARIEALGGVPLRLPLLDIEPLGASAQERLAAASTADCWIFTSANAVRQVGEDLPWPPQVVAVGAGTARALEAAGHPSPLVPAAGYSAAAVLDLPEMQAVQDRHIVIVTGENGLTALADTLAARGARVETVPVYRRVPVPYTPAEMTAALNQSDLLLLTSGDALQVLLEAVPGLSEREHLLDLPVVVPSVRVLELARSAGFRGEIRVPASMSDESLVQSLQALAAETDRAVAAVPEPRPTETMAEPSNSDKEPRAIAPPARGRVLRVFVWLAWLLLLLLVAAAAAGTWAAWQFREQTLEALDAQQTLLSRTAREATGVGAELGASRQRLADLTQAQRQLSQDLDRLRSQVEVREQLLGELQDSVRGDRDELQLATVEQLLFLASERLQLARDVAGARRALQLADERLAAMADPRLFKVREAIAAERRSLAAVPSPDRASAALALASLIHQVPRLPLARGLPDDYEPPPAPGAPDGAAPWWRRVLDKLGAALSSVLTVKRTDTPIEPLLGPERQELTQTILLLKLEAARAALLGGNTAQFRESLASAADWLRTHYDPAAPAVAAAIAELESQQRLELSPPLPELGESLSRLRAAMDAPSP